MADNLADDDTGGTNSTNSNIPLAQKVKDAAISASKPGESAVGGTVFPGQSSSTTISGKSNTPAGAVGISKPDKRWKNPLANFSSYTYQLSLYMITPDAYDAFIQSGRRDINAFSNAANSDAYNSGNGAYLICQSGGINNTSTQRAPGFDVDFFIDDLKITQAINGKDSGSATNTSDMSFTITEPYGFSFISRLKKAQTALNQVTKSKNYADIKDPMRSFFVLGIQFLGYDAEGNLINSKDIPGTEGDPQGNKYGLYQRYWDILITGMKFKIEGKSVIYNITAAAVSKNAFGVKRGIVDQGAKVVGKTVYDALLGGSTSSLTPSETNMSQSSAGEGAQGLLTKLNNDQAKRLAAGAIGIAAKWDVKFLGEADNSIRNASIVSRSDLDKKKLPMTPIKQTSDSTVAQERSASPNLTAREITIPGGISILQAVNTIILQSSYMENALKIVYTTAEQPDTQKNSEEAVEPTNEKTLKWYTISAEIKVLGWDIKQSDFVYDTTYVIQPYETPVVTSAYTKAATSYYGPHKRYEYWFTGKNSEILGYEQNMDNTYFNVTLKADGSSDSSGGATNSPVITGKSQGQPDQGRLNVGLEAQNSYMTSLYDPGAYALAKIRIIGDPDFLMQTSTSSINALYNRFYGTDGFTVNPNGGQVFIEINFKEPTDYKNSDGLLGINESIIFWEYPADVQKEINSRGGGVSYMLVTCVSTFRGGKFEQELTATINTFGTSNSKSKAAVDSGRSSNGSSKPGETQMSESASRTGAGTNAATPDGNATTAATGYSQSSNDIINQSISETDQFTGMYTSANANDDAASKPVNNISAYQYGGRE